MGGLGGFRIKVGFKKRLWVGLLGMAWIQFFLELQVDWKTSQRLFWLFFFFLTSILSPREKTSFQKILYKFQCVINLSIKMIVEVVKQTCLLVLRHVFCLDVYKNASIILIWTLLLHLECFYCTRSLILRCAIIYCHLKEWLGESDLHLNIPSRPLCTWFISCYRYKPDAVADFDSNIWVPSRIWHSPGVKWLASNLNYQLCQENESDCIKGAERGLNNNNIFVCARWLFTPKDN